MKLSAPLWMEVEGAEGAGAAGAMKLPALLDVEVCGDTGVVSRKGARRAIVPSSFLSQSGLGLLPNGENRGYPTFRYVPSVSTVGRTS